MAGLEKAMIADAAGKDPPIPVLFNPEEYTLSKDNNFAQAAVPGLSSPILQFVNGGMETLDMELLLDTHEAHVEAGRKLNGAGDDVRRYTNRLTKLMEIDPRTHAPPVLVFTWSSLSFTCVLARLNQRFVLFRPDGRPVRARVQVTFNEFRNAELEAKEVKRETAHYSKSHVVGGGETISSIAATAYDDPALWRPIALRNQLDDPRALRPGVEIAIPPLPFRDAETGVVYG